MGTVRCQAYVEWFTGPVTLTTKSDEIGRLCGKKATTDARMADGPVGPICEKCFGRIKAKIAPKRLFRLPLEKENNGN